MITNENIDKVFKLVERQVKGKEPYVSLLSLKKRDPFKILIATVLSARTKDNITKESCKKLFKLVKSPRDLIKISEEEIEKLIYPVGFYKQKAKYLKRIAEVLVKKYDGRVPDSIEELMKLPGVGRKTANLVVVLGFNKYGICVDTHVHRIVNRWGYVNTKKPEETEFALRKKLPKRYWKVINTLLVAFGQTVCLPTFPKCSFCELNKFCPKIGVKKV